MKRNLAVLAVLAFGVLGAGNAFAQAASATDTITVSATNRGVFTFDIAAAVYTFGDVDSTGAANASGTQSLTGTPIANGATYTSSVASTWAVNSAPRRTTRIFNSSTTSTINWGAANRLEMAVTAVTNQASGSALTPVLCSYKMFGTTGDDAAGCTAGALARNFLAGTGVNAATGNLDFRLTVLDTDVAGVSNSWTVQLTASGS